MSFIHEATKYLEIAESLIPKQHFKPGQIDHICYRATTTSEYLKLCEQLALQSRLLTESDVNGRPISCFFFPEGIISKNNVVYVVEVASPKPGAKHLPGFEHIEIFSDDPQDNDLYFEDVRIKFCKKRLLDLVQDERWEKCNEQLSTTASIFNASKSRSELYGITKNTEILQKLSEHNPRICGTFPLGISHAGSDIDIACEASDLIAFKKTLQIHFQKYSDFKIINTDHHITCQFRVQNTLIEIYGENKPTEKQNAYVHMMVEAQLLTYTGEWVSREIINLKASGATTEEAFAKFFEIAGDPYKELYILYNNKTKLKELSQKRLLKL